MTTPTSPRTGSHWLLATRSGSGNPLWLLATCCGAGRLPAQELPLRLPDPLARFVEVGLCRFECFERRGSGNPTTSYRLDHRQRLERLRSVAQALMGAMKPLAFLLGEFLWLASRLHA